MTLDLIFTLEVIEILENYIQRIRPQENIRDKLDIGYKIENQSIIIHEIRPRFDNPILKIEPAVAKATYIKSKKVWKVYWLRANLQWYSYDPKPEVKSIKSFVKLVEEDKYHCFCG